MNSNYPPGAEFDPRAPWNQKDLEVKQCHIDAASDEVPECLYLFGAAFKAGEFCCACDEWGAAKWLKGRINDVDEDALIVPAMWFTETELRDLEGYVKEAIELRAEQLAEEDCGFNDDSGDVD